VSYITFFSRVLEHVPARALRRRRLLRMAVTNAFVPRFIMPDKPELPSDSYYTRRFAGIQVAETGTSVSIGYMAEFFADWGLPGMFLSIAAYGLWIGLVAGVVRVLTPVPLMRFAALTVVLLAVADFEQQFIKGFAALNLNMLVTLVLLLVLRPWLVRAIGVRTASVPDAASASSRSVRSMTESRPRRRVLAARFSANGAEGLAGVATALAVHPGFVERKRRSRHAAARRIRAARRLRQTPARHGNGRKQLFERPRWIFSHLRLARVERYVPSTWRTPCAVFLHGIECWTPPPVAIWR
jgi:hypothetical protein